MKLRKRLAVAAAVLIPAFALGAEQTLYQIDLVPKDKLIARDMPVLKGTTYTFHQYPTGTLISIRKSSVKSITKLSPEAAAAASPTSIKPIKDLAFQGPKQSLSGGGGRGGRYTRIDSARSAAAAAAAGTAGRTASPD